jgi:hypothetical protein
MYGFSGRRLGRFRRKKQKTLSQAATLLGRYRFSQVLDVMKEDAMEVPAAADSMPMLR